MGDIALTTLALKDLPFPHGWFDDKGYPWNHNNMDIVTIFSYGWQYMSPDNRATVAKEIEFMLNYSLTNSLQPNGQFKFLVVDDSPSTAEYFGCAFLGRSGFFNDTRRFWTNETFPDSPKIQKLIETYIRGQLKVVPPNSSDYVYLLNALTEIGVSPPLQYGNEIVSKLENRIK